MALSITELLDRTALESDLLSREKNDVIIELCQFMANLHPVGDPHELIRRILEREKLGSTGIGHGIAIPHCKLPDLDRLYCVFGRCVQGCDFQSIDGEPARIFFLLVAPENVAGVHLQALAKISRLCQKESFRKRILEAPDADAIYRIMKMEEEAS